MPDARFSRRDFLRTSTVLAGGMFLAKGVPRASGFEKASDRPRIGIVGCGSRWGWQLANGGTYGVGPEFARFGDYVAVCDVDQRRLDAAKSLVRSWNGNAPDGTVDYREIIERDDIDVVTIFTPDHWHAKIAVEAMLAGKDVYCEKPMTLTIGEGQQICDVCRSTGRIFQVGSQQRSDTSFMTAVALIRAGRLGRLTRMECVLGGGPTSPDIPAVEPPRELDWNRWLGPAPEVAYRALSGAPTETGEWSRCHYEFRWWYEYSGGKLTDWGAHHVDIATWAAGKVDTGPVSVEPVSIEHPVPFEIGYPTRDDCYNTPTRFHFQVKYEDGLELAIRDEGRNGVLFEGTEGRIFVGRGRLTGKPAEDLADNPLPEDALAQVYKGRKRAQIPGGSYSTAHVEAFFQALVDRREAISDVFSHHRALTTCHLAGIAARLGRTIKWDPTNETIVDDDQAQALIGREKRKGFEIEM